MFRSRTTTRKRERDSDDATSSHARWLHAVYQSKAVIECEMDGTILFANERFLALTGLEPENVKGQNHRRFVSAAYAGSAEYRSFWETLRSARPVTGQFQRIDNQGREIWLQAECNPVLDERGQPCRVIMFASDITEQYLEKVSTDAQLQAIHDAQAVIEFDLHGNILKVNQNFIDTVGYSREEIIGQNHRLFVDEQEQKSPEYKQHWQRLRDGEFISGEFRRVGKHGRPIWMHGNYIPIIAPSGKVMRIMKYASDITQSVEANDSLRNMLEEASTVMNSIAEGDLTRRIQGSYPPPLDSLGEAINSAIRQISAVILRVNTNSTTLKASSIALDKNSQDARKAANATADEARDAYTTTEKIASDAAETVRALSEMNVSIRQIAEESQKAANVAEQAVGLSSRAREDLSRLADSSEGIGAVVKVINSIAEQTNLLALNATIEAARAGESGKGFAVVANEVKELAKETARATEEVSDKIAAIQKDSQAATNVINAISETIGSINDSQSAIAAAVEEQRAVSADACRTIDEASASTRNVALGVQQVANLADESLSANERGKTASEQLTRMANELEQMISQFSLLDDQRPAD